MSQPPSLQQWLGALTEHDLIAVTGAATFSRGRAYAREGMVKSVRLARDRVFGEVTGNQRYTVLVSVDLGDGDTIDFGPSWDAACTCPVAIDCKHSVAVLLAAKLWHGASSGPADTTVVLPEWERLVKPVATLPATPESDPPVGIGLFFEVRPPAFGNSGSVFLHPVLPAKRGGWRRSGLTWSDLALHPRTPVLAEHREIVNELNVRAQARGFPSFGRQDFLDTGAIGPSCIDILRRCQAAGVALVGAGEASGDVTLETEPVTLRLRAEQHDGQVALALGFDAPDDKPAGGERPIFLGLPAWGVAFINDATRELRLARLSAPVEADLLKLYKQGPITLPAADVQRFTTEYLPHLQHRLPVVSVDDALELPEVSAPEILVRLTPTSGLHQLVVEFDWRYHVDERPVAFPLSTRRPVTGLPGRDPVAEAGLLESLGFLRFTRELYAHHQLRDRVTLDGLTTARFVSHLVPELQKLPQVVVELAPELPEYREDVSEPKIVISADDSEPGRTDWFDLAVSVTVGGHVVPFRPLFEALAADEEYLLLESGVWFRLDHPELHTLRDLIDEARLLQDRHRDGLQINRFHTSLWEDLRSIAEVEHQSSHWASTVERLRSAESLLPPQPPSGLIASLRPYQEKGFAWLSTLWQLGLGGILADDMGLGKTVQTLAAILAAAERGALCVDGRHTPVLVVAPTSVVGTWAEQAAQFAPSLRVTTVTETATRRKDKIGDLAAEADIVVTSYTLLRLEAEAYQEIAWAAMILDEAQAVKNYRAKTYAEVRKVRSDFTLAITGTPLENSLMDLWSLLSIAAPGLYPDPQIFTEAYRKPIEAGNGAELLDRLRRRIAPLMLRRRKDEVAPDLPPKIEQVLQVDLSPSQRKVYSQHLQRERQRVLGMLGDVEENRIAILAALTKLRQLALAPALLDEQHAHLGSAKIDVLVEHLRQLRAEGHRALVFSQFTSFLSLVRERLSSEQISYRYLDGSTRDRTAEVAAFRGGDDPVFLISLKAGGFGLTLTEADYVFVLDPWWNPAAENQAIDRTHRIGQQNPVMVYRLVSADTIENKVVALQARKRHLFDEVVEGGNAVGGALTADDIRALLSD